MLFVIARLTVTQRKEKDKGVVILIINTTGTEALLPPCSVSLRIQALDNTNIINFLPL